MTTIQAFKKFTLDVPNILISIVCALIAWTVADSLGKSPNLPETVWFGLTSAGIYYHWSGLIEILKDREALLQWPEHDGVDLETIDNATQRERSRLVAKGVFASAGLISMLLPPRIQEYDVFTQFIVVLLILGVVALDINAILDRVSRRKQIELIKLNIEKRKIRRRYLEERFLPLFEIVATKTSIRGRRLAHDIYGKLSIVVGCADILKDSPRLDTEERAMVLALDDAISEIVSEVGELHQLVRDLVVPQEELDGPKPADPREPSRPTC
jgi:hypothetical protein